MAGRDKVIAIEGVAGAKTTCAFLRAGAPDAPKAVWKSQPPSAAQLERFLKGLRPEDRVLLIDDPRQHQSVEAGVIFEQRGRPGGGQLASRYI